MPKYRLVCSHPIVLAAIARHFVHGQVEGAHRGYRSVRIELAEGIRPHAVDAALTAYRGEGRRLVAAERAAAWWSEDPKPAVGAGAVPGTPGSTTCHQPHSKRSDRRQLPTSTIWRAGCLSVSSWLPRCPRGDDARRTGAASSAVLAPIALRFQADNFEDVLTRIVETAVSALSDCDMASITVREGKETFRTLASTHSAALEVDEAQYEVREGPCLDAVDTAIVHAPSFPDPRWPNLAGRPADSGVGTILSYGMAAPGRTADNLAAGSLNAYAGTPQAFGDEAREIGLILAAHASVGIQAVREREAFEQLGRQLHEALSSRDVIGQAKGILMERLRITPEDAFDTLRRASQRLNLKLREIAGRLAETGTFDDPSGN